MGPSPVTLAGVSRRKTQGAETRRSILTAAERLFSDQGYAATSMDQVARVAQTSKSSIFWHFATKEELMLAVAEQAMERWEAEIGAALLDATDAPARLDLLVNGYERLAQTEAGGLRLLLTLSLESMPDSPVRQRLQRVALAYRRSIEMVLSEGEAAGQFRLPAPAADLAGVALGALEGLFMQHHLDPSAASFDGLRALLDRALAH